MRRRRAGSKGRVAAIACVLAALAGGLAIARCGRDAASDARGDAATAGVSIETSAAARLQARATRPPAFGPNGSISGVIRGDDGASIVGARVCVRPRDTDEDAAEDREAGGDAGGGSDRVADPARGSDGELDAENPMVCVTTGVRGEYAIAPLRARAYVVVAGAAQRRPTWSDDVVLAPGQRRMDVDLVLRDGGVLVSGTVSDRGGGAIEHAHVAASDNETYRTAVETETDALGHYEVWVAPGGVGIDARAEGYADAYEVATAPGTCDLALTPGASLAGLVIDAVTHAPVAGAEVHIATTSDMPVDPTQSRDVNTGGDGRFSVDRLPTSRYAVRVIADRLYGRSDGSVPLAVGARREVVIELHRAARVEATLVVTAADGGPDRVCAHPSAQLTRAAEHRDGMRTGSAGHLAFAAVLPGTYEVAASCADAQPSSGRAKIVVGDADVDAGSVRLVPDPPTGAIRGRVVSRSGAPVGDVGVYGGGERAVTDGEGHYALRHVRAGNVTLQLFSNAGVSPRVAPTVMVVAGATADRDLVIEEGGAVAGSVVDSAGAPAADLLVTLMYPAFRVGRTDARGAFRFDHLPSAVTTVDVTGTDGRRVRGDVAITDGHTATVRLVVPVPGGRLTGMLVDAHGAPVGDGTVFAAREVDGHASSHVGLASPLDALTAQDGTFAIGPVPEGLYTLRARRPGSGEAVVRHVATGSHTRVQLERPGGIEGTVMTPEGAPLEVQVVVTSADGPTSRREAFFRTGGHFQVDDLPAGDYRVAATVQDVEAEANVAVHAGEQPQVALALDATASVVGRVLDFDTGRPVPGAVVTAAADARSPATMTSGSDGRFTRAGVPHGWLDIRVAGPVADYAPLALRANAVGSTLDLGDIRIVRRRAAAGQAGDVGMSVRYGYTSDVRPGGPAAVAGIVDGEWISTIDGVSVHGLHADALTELLGGPPGTRYTLALERGATVVLVSGPRAP